MLLLLLDHLTYDLNDLSLYHTVISCVFYPTALTTNRSRLAEDR